jgi:hypothetical protein
VHLEKVHVENNEFNSPDYVEVELWVRNERETFPTASPLESTAVQEGRQTLEAVPNSEADTANQQSSGE